METHPSRENPADLISLGVNPSDLEYLELWWSGPSFVMEEIIDDSCQNDLNSSEKELYITELKTISEFGGIWETGVKSFKYHLKRTISNLNLTIEEFLTVVNQIEGILNSQPLIPLYSDPNDFSSLTPGHFLIGRPINSIPEPKIIDIPDNRLCRWQ
ncbi:reverse transcriptase domain-containing protein [Trichonephila clavipes]|nr:reverse transcriptase domain-containing protein [Trichonephila clavipes]